MFDLSKKYFIVKRKLIFFQVEAPDENRKSHRKSSLVSFIPGRKRELNRPHRITTRRSNSVVETVLVIFKGKKISMYYVPNAFKQFFKIHLLQQNVPKSKENILNLFKWCIWKTFSYSPCTKKKIMLWGKFVIVIVRFLKSISFKYFD